MSDNEEILGNDETGNELANASIQELRKWCKLFSIPAGKEWKSEDYIRALKDRMQQVELVKAANEEQRANAPEPGFARLIVHKDPTPNASNRSIPIGVNGRLFQIPRGIEVDVPIPIYEALKVSTTTTTVNTNPNAKNMAEEKFEQVTSTAYPYSLVAITPGPYKNENDQRVKQYILRLRFVEKYGKWPTAAELNSAITRGAIDGLNK